MSGSMKSLILLGCLLGASFAAEESKPTSTPSDTRTTPPAEAPQKVEEKARKADEVVVTVTATKSEKETFETPYNVSVVSQEELRSRLQISNFVDAYKEASGVFIQKTSQGQGSPYIRGFTAYRNLLLIDGVRFNRSIFREGANQYWATIDPLGVSRVELVRGPGSALYGSDAVGGTINVLTKSTDTWSDKTEVGGEAYYRFSTAERSNIGHLEVKGSHKDLVGFYFGGSFKDYDDFVAGGGTGVVDNSAWQEYAIDGKVEFRPAENHTLTLFGQYFHQTEVPRTEQTVFSKSWEGTAVGTNYRYDLDQDRYLSYAKYKAKNLNGPVQDMEVTLSYQRTGEDLVRYRPDGALPVEMARRDSPNEMNVDTYGAQIQFKSKVPYLGVMTYGADYFRDEVDSRRKEYRWRGTPRTPQLQTHQQGPVADDSSYEQLGVYAQDEKDLFDGMLTLLASGRFEYIQMQAGKVEDQTNSSNNFSIGEHWTSLTGNFRFMVRPDHKDGDHWRVFGGVSQAFRAPSLYDFTSYDSNSFLFEQPATGLEPETFLNFEGGVKARYGKVEFGATYFHTLIDNMILRAPTGQTIGAQTVVEKINGGEGVVKGIEFEGTWRFLPDFRLWTTLSWQEGDLDQYDNDLIKREKPFSKMIPVMSHMGLVYEPLKENWWVEIHADVFSTADRLAVVDRSDTRRIPSNGTPGFAVFGIRGGVKFLDDRLSICGSIENIANEEYRIHGSGQNMPGTNFTLSLCYRW